MNRFLDKFVVLIFFTCPTFAKRMNIAIRAQIKYAHLYRDRPLPDEQIHGRHADVPPSVMWRRHLDKYLDVYERTRIPGLFPETEYVRMHKT